MTSAQHAWGAAVLEIFWMVNLGILRWDSSAVAMLVVMMLNDVTR